MSGRFSDAAALAEKRQEEAERGEAWHPLIRGIHSYWQSIHPNEDLPGRRHFDPIQVPELLPHIWLLDVQAEPFSLRYRLAGTMIVQLLGREVTGLSFAEAHPDISPDSAYLEIYRLAARKGVPSWRRGTPNFFTRPDVASVETIILPLADDGKHVDILLLLSVVRAIEGPAGNGLRHFLTRA